jgi:pimeloyl-ACP methyl ester carboxylesterase
MPMIERLIGHKSLIEKATPGSRTEIDSPEKMRRALAFYRANLKPWAPLKLRVGNITQPGMVIHAQKDAAITSQIMEVTARQFDDLREYAALPGPHFLHNQCPDLLNPVLLRFLREVV